MNLKQTLVTLVAFASAASAFAGIEVRLNRSEKIRMMDYGVLEKVVVVPAGTIVEYAQRPGLGKPAGTRFINNNGHVQYSRSPWKRVLNIELQRGSLRHLPDWQRRQVRNTVRDINEYGAKNRGDDRDGYTPYFISQWSVENMATPVGGGYYGDDDGGHVIIDAPTHTTTTTYVNDGSYQVCYQNVEERWSRDGKQAVDGFFKTLIGGAVGAVGVDIFQNSDDALGKIVGGIFAIGGAAVAVEGISDIANSYKLESIQYNGVSCKTYYRPVRRISRHSYGSMRSCYSQEYQSTSWDGTYYYYETTCSQGGRNHTFYQYSSYTLY
jgi:hypothetical protein